MAVLFAHGSLILARTLLGRLQGSKYKEQKKYRGTKNKKGTPLYFLNSNESAPLSLKGHQDHH